MANFKPLPFAGSCFVYLLGGLCLMIGVIILGLASNKFYSSNYMEAECTVICYVNSESLVLVYDNVLYNVTINVRCIDEGSYIKPCYFDLDDILATLSANNPIILFYAFLLPLSICLILCGSAFYIVTFVSIYHTHRFYEKYVQLA